MPFRCGDGKRAAARPVSLAPKLCFQTAVTYVNIRPQKRGLF